MPCTAISSVVFTAEQEQLRMLNVLGARSPQLRHARHEHRESLRRRDAAL